MVSSQLYTTTNLEVSNILEINLGKKAKAAINLFLEHLEKRINNYKLSYEPFKIWQKSNIPVGKGLSSSSADILGALISLNTYFDNPLHKKELYRLAATIDPTDACISPPLTVINQHNGEVIDVLPSLPYSLIWFDSEPEKQVNTVTLTKNKKFTRQDYRFYNHLFKEISGSIIKSNYTDFIFWVTQSAIYNQKFLPKKNLKQLLLFALELNLGVFVAHSGTIMGLVMPNDKPKNEIVSRSLNFIKRNWDVNAHVECYQGEDISFS